MCGHVRRCDSGHAIWWNREALLCAVGRKNCQAYEKAMDAGMPSLASPRTGGMERLEGETSRPNSQHNTTQQTPRERREERRIPYTARARLDAAFPATGEQRLSDWDLGP